MSENTWKRIVQIVGIGFGSVALWRIVKYIFGASIVFWAIAILLAVKMISGTYLSALNTMNQHELERYKVRAALELKDKDAEREHELKVAEFNLQQAKLAKQSKDTDLKVRLTASEEIDHKVRDMEEKEWAKYNDLQRTLTAAIKLHDDTHEPDLVIRIYELRKQVANASPSLRDIDNKKAEIRRGVLIAYGLMQDPSVQTARIEPAIDPTKIEIIVPDPPMASPVNIFQQRYGIPQPAFTPQQPQYKQGAGWVIQQQANRYGLRR